MVQPNPKVTYLYKKRRKGSFLALGLFLLFCLSLSGYFFLNSAFFNLREIQVSGCQTITEDEVIDLSGLVLGTNLFHLDAGEVVKRVELHPVVKTVRVSRKIPHTVLIKVEERVPVALVVGTDSYLAVDREGVFLRKEEDFFKELTFPVITGFTVEEGVSPGANLSTPGLSAALSLLEKMDPAFLKNVAEIKATSPYSLTLQMLNGVEVRFGEPEKIERKLQLIEELLFEKGEVINDQTVEYIDLRYNSLPVIKQKILN